MIIHKQSPIGNFSCDEPELRLVQARYTFSDHSGNKVAYSLSHPSDITITIKSPGIRVFSGRLRVYLERLVRSMGERLHDRGKKLFSEVSIAIPYQHPVSEYEVVVEVFEGGDRTQDMAREIMAALSDMPLYKAMAPRGTFHGFIRVDDPMSREQVCFLHTQCKVMLDCSYVPFAQILRISLTPSSCDPDGKLAFFKQVMNAYLREYVPLHTGLPFVYSYGSKRYESIKPRNKDFTIDVSMNSEGCFELGIPYSERLKTMLNIMVRFERMHREEMESRQ